MQQRTHHIRRGPPASTVYMPQLYSFSVCTHGMVTVQHVTVPLYNAHTLIHNLTCVSTQAEIIAGISVGAMVVRQGMSYAKLAGLPNVYGLYGAFVPVMIYAILGSSPQLVSNLFRGASCSVAVTVCVICQ